MPPKRFRRFHGFCPPHAPAGGPHNPGWPSTAIGSGAVNKKKTLLLAAIAVFALAGPWMLTMLVEYIRRVIEAMPAAVV